MGRRLLTAIVAAGLLLAVAACGSSSSGGSSAGPGAAGCPGNAAPASGTTITITAADYCFMPATLNLDAGKEVKVTFINAGGNEHNLTVGSTDVGEADSGKTQTFTFTPAGSGTIQFFCKYHKDKNMVGAANLTGTTTPAAPVTPAVSPRPATSNPYGY